MCESYDVRCGLELHFRSCQEELQKLIVSEESELMGAVVEETENS